MRSGEVSSIGQARGSSCARSRPGRSARGSSCWWSCGGSSATSAGGTRVAVAAMLAIYPVRRVGDPRLPAAREADAHPRQGDRDGRGASPSRPSRRPERPGHGPPLLVAGRLPDAGGGPADDRHRRRSRHPDRRAGAARRADQRRDRRLLHGLRLRVDPLPDPHLVRAADHASTGRSGATTVSTTSRTSTSGTGSRTTSATACSARTPTSARCRSPTQLAPWTPPVELRRPDDEPRRALDPLAARRGDAARRPPRASASPTSSSRPRRSARCSRAPSRATSASRSWPSTATSGSARSTISTAR